jgi:hypothetical protein
MEGQHGSITIQAKVFLDEQHVYEPESSYVIVRKITWTADGRIARKEALQLDGSWVVVPEGEAYPTSAHLPIAGLATPKNPDGLVTLQDEATHLVRDGFRGHVYRSKGEE